MNRLQLILIDLLQAIYLIALWCAPLSLLGLVLLGNRHPEMFALELKQKSAVFWERTTDKTLNCNGNVALTEVHKDGSTSSSKFPLSTGKWYSVPSSGQITCETFSLTFQNQTVFRIVSSSFHLPVFEILQGALEVNTGSMSGVGIYISDWGKIYWDRPWRLKISRRAGSAVFLAGDQSQEGSIFVLKNRGVLKNGMVQLEWNDPKLISIFFSESFAGYKPFSEHQLLLY